jgi:Flp pilus assembly protein TadD
MSDSVRLDDLRRRIEKDPASIAFAQLAEEYRRLGRHQDAIDICRNGLARHPSYLSARVTLGRALLQMDSLEEARQEFEHVLKEAPQNLSALKILGDIYSRLGDVSQALARYQAALLLAPNDPEVERKAAEMRDSLARSANEREHRRAQSVVAALEQWLAAIHVTRTQRRA